MYRNTRSTKVRPVVRYKYNSKKDIVSIDEGFLYRLDIPDFDAIYAYAKRLSGTNCADEKNGRIIIYGFQKKDSVWTTDIPKEEGDIYRNTFWLTQRDDTRARQIIDDYLLLRNHLGKAEVISRQTLGKPKMAKARC